MLLPNYMQYLESFHLYLTILGHMSWWDPQIPLGSIDEVQHLSDLGQSCARTFCHIHVLSSGQDHKRGHWDTGEQPLLYWWFVYLHYKIFDVPFWMMNTDNCHLLLWRVFSSHSDAECASSSATFWPTCRRPLELCCQLGVSVPYWKNKG